MPITVQLMLIINYRNFKILDLCWIHSGRAFRNVKWLFIDSMPSVSLKSIYNFTSALKKPQNFSFWKFVLSSFTALCWNDVIMFLFMCHYTVIIVPYINQKHAYFTENMWCDHLESKHFKLKLQKAKGLYYGLFYLY